MGHILLSGHGGVGKTFILNEVCSELGYCRHVTQGSRLSSPKAVKNFLIAGSEQALSQGAPAFFIIDEIHEMSLKCQEELYYPMDHSQLLTQNKPIPLCSFILAGATTDPELLNGKSLVNRFVHHWEVEEMSDLDIYLLLSQFFERERMSIEHDALMNICNRSRGIPRLALKYARRCRDYAQCRRSNRVEMSDTKMAFDELRIDEIGLDEVQRKYLNILASTDRPVGLEVLANRLNEMKTEQVKKLVEPYLWKLGLICSSSRGRELTYLAGLV